MSSDERKDLSKAEWKIMKSGERRTVKDDQYLLDDKVVVWGKGTSSGYTNMADKFASAFASANYQISGLGPIPQP